MATPPDTLRERFFNSEFRVGDGIATFADLDPTLFRGLETIEQVSADRDAMDAIAGTEDYRELVRSVNAMDAQLVDTTAMSAVGASQTARDAIRADSGVFSRVRSNSMPLAKFIVGVAGGTPSNVANMTDLAGNATVMNDVAASQAARDEIQASTLATDKIRADPVGAGKYLAGVSGLTPSNFSDVGAVTSSVNGSEMGNIAASEFAAGIANSTVTGTTQLHLNNNINPDYWDAPGSQETWNSGTFSSNGGPEPFIVQSGDTIQGNTNATTPIGNGYSLGFRQDSSSDEGTWAREFNFDNISQIIITTRNTLSNALSIEVAVGTTTVLSYTKDGTTTHTIGVSQTGTKPLTVNFVDKGAGKVPSEVGLIEFN